MRYLVVPRVVGMMVSVFSLTVLFTAATFVSGYLMSALAMGATNQRPLAFFGSLARVVELRDVFNLLAKTLGPGFMTATLCCTEGLSVTGAATEIPQATTRGLTRSITALLFTSAIVSVLTYV
jgi:phospholipid/cholesterol/gamma-HCH transport system permease protein